MSVKHIDFTLLSESQIEQKLVDEDFKNCNDKDKEFVINRLISTRKLSSFVEAQTKQNKALQENLKSFYISAINSDNKEILYYFDNIIKYTMSELEKNLFYIFVLSSIMNSSTKYVEHLMSKIDDMSSKDNLCLNIAYNGDNIYKEKILERPEVTAKIILDNDKKFIDKVNVKKFKYEYPEFFF